jgi:sugar lactone lactonase YvrE
MKHDGGRAAYAATKIIATWPEGSFAENLAIDGAGSIFVTLHTDRAVVRIDPASGIVTPFAVFDLPVAGLAFARNGSLLVSGGQPGTTPGAIWQVEPDGSVRRIATLPDAAFLNGMTPHSDGRRILVADSIGGIVYAIDPDTGVFEPWLANDRMKPLPGDMTPGVNGVKLYGGYAYVSVTARDAIYRAPIGPDGAAGPLEIFAENLRADDFAIDIDGNLYIATHPAHSLVRLAPDGARATLGGKEHGLLCATAVAFGRTAADDRSVYVTTTGGTMILPSEQCEPAKLVRLDVGTVGHPLLGTTP